MALITISRSRSKDTASIATPDQKTIPSAWGQVYARVPTTEKAIIAFISMPGATANGSRAHSPMAMVARPPTAAVAKKAAAWGMPPWSRMAGLTMTM
jgi:hypothetical protein